VFAAAYRVMQRLAPAQLTLAEIASEAGLTAGALVQRFGSKRALMLRLMEEYSASTPQMFAHLRSSHGSPLAALRGYAQWMAKMGETPAALAHHLSYLQLDFTDPDFHQFARAQAVATQDALSRIVQEAIDVGELVKHTDADEVARLTQSLVGGSLLAWGFFRDGTAERWVGRDVDAMLAPYLVENRGK
jgi:AcrR family transcriptional regulator